MRSRITLRSIRATKKKRKRNADRRVILPSALARGSREASRARLSAFHHGACCSEPTPQLSSRRTSWDVVVGGRYPPSPVPVQRLSRRPVIMPAGRFPEAAREQSLKLWNHGKYLLYPGIR
jgi:hypothetical protein